MEEADLKTRTDAKQLINTAKEFKYRLKIIKGESGNLRGEFHKVADQEPKSMLVLYNFKEGKKVKLKKQFKELRVKVRANVIDNDLSDKAKARIASVNHAIENNWIYDEDSLRQAEINSKH